MSNANFYYLDKQIAATRTLLKFCLDHQRQGMGPGYIENIRSCLATLEQRDIDAALSHYESVPLGNGPMRLNDCAIPCVFESENPEYVFTVFEALISNWSHLMRLSLPPKQCRVCDKEIPNLYVIGVCPSCYLITHRMA